MGMSVGEGTTLDILTANPHVIAFVDERGESECFGSTPIDTNTRIDGLITCLENLDDLWMEVSLRRKNGDLVSKLS